MLAKAPPPPKAQPVPTGAIIDLRYVFNRWLLVRKTDAERGEIRFHTYGQYRRSGKRIDAVAGERPVHELTPDDTADIYSRIAAAHGIDAAKRAVAHLRDACRYAADHHWCPAINYGEKAVRKLASRGAPTMDWALYEPAHVRRILARVDELIATGIPRSRTSGSR
jgi:hypothetical protein